MVSSNVWALDFITERAWLEDSTGQLKWPAVTEQIPQAFNGVLSQGFGSSAIWLRLRLDPHVSGTSTKPGENLILRIRPLYLDDIQVFDPLTSGLTSVTGDHHHPRLQTLEGMDFMLPIARGNAPRDIWIRMSSTSTRQIAVQALHPDDLRKLTQMQQMVFALYVAVILVFMVWGLVHWIFSREKVTGIFALKQSAALAFAFFSLGYARVIWPANWSAMWLDNLTTVAGLVAVSAAVYFHIFLIREFEPPSWSRFLMKGLLALLPIKLFLMAIAQPMQAAALNMVEILLAPLIFLVSVIFSKVWKSQPDNNRLILPRWVLIGFYLILVLMLAVASFPGLGLSQGGEIPLYLVQAHGLVTAFLMLLILQYRTHLHQIRQREIALELERSQILILHETNIREEQDKLMTMLTHELKTPLAIMNLRLDIGAEGSREIRNAIRDMNAVIERCVQISKLGDQQLQAHKAPVQCDALVKMVIADCTQPNRVHFTSTMHGEVNTDQQLLFIVISNLIENAIKYSHAYTPIEIELCAVTDPQLNTPLIRLELSNLPGTAGWPEANKVFKKYYRSPQARRQSGTGLGLFLVNNLVEILGGRVAYKPDASKVRFIVWLPM